ncbi:hypothetical protein tb265_32360 [Gemmatimonadetes bacterium T265]|nr:hypothetical protein tb265_32360 [Gemmatimonadetes bacterium T265]
MARPQSWRDVTVGIVALAATIGAGLVVLLFARVGALHGRTITLYAATPDATGVLPGSEVWLAGQKVGRVQALGFRPPSVDTALRVLLTLEVLAEHQTLIRRGARVAVRPGTSLIGSPVIAVATSSINTGPPVRDGDTLFANPNDQFETLRARVTSTAGTELPLIVDNLRVLAVQLRTAQGTLGAIGVGGSDRLAATAQVLGRIAERAGTAGGTIGAVRTGPLTDRARAVLARVNVIRDRLANPGTSPGRFRTDSALWRSLDSLRTDLADVQRLLDSPDGTAGRLRQDARLRRELAGARTELDALLADTRRNPLRYIAF